MSRLVPVVKKAVILKAEGARSSGGVVLPVLCTMPGSSFQCVCSGRPLRAWEVPLL